MTGFERQTSGIGNNRSTNLAATAALAWTSFTYALLKED